MCKWLFHASPTLAISNVFIFSNLTILKKIKILSLNLPSDHTIFYTSRSFICCSRVLSATSNPRFQTGGGAGAGWTSAWIGIGCSDSVSPLLPPSGSSTPAWGCSAVSGLAGSVLAGGGGGGVGSGWGGGGGVGSGCGGGYRRGVSIKI